MDFAVRIARNMQDSELSLAHWWHGASALCTPYPSSSLPNESIKQAPIRLASRAASGTRQATEAHLLPTGGDNRDSEAVQNAQSISLCAHLAWSLFSLAFQSSNALRGKFLTVPRRRAVPLQQRFASRSEVERDHVSSPARGCATGSTRRVQALMAGRYATFRSASPPARLAPVPFVEGRRLWRPRL